MGKYFFGNCGIFGVGWVVWGIWVLMEIDEIYVIIEKFVYVVFFRWVSIYIFFLEYY